MERNFSVVSIFRNVRASSRGILKIQNSKILLGKFLFHSIPHAEFWEFLVEWKAPMVYGKELVHGLFTNENETYKMWLSMFP